MIECTSEFQRLDHESMSTIDQLVTDNKNLRRKLQTLPVIEQAKGILMGRYQIPADDAFEMLRRCSQDTNTTRSFHPCARHGSFSAGPDALERRKQEIANKPAKTGGMFSGMLSRAEEERKRREAASGGSSGTKPSSGGTGRNVSGGSGSKGTGSKGTGSKGTG